MYAKARRAAATARRTVGLKQGVLLLDAEPRLVLLDPVHDMVARDARVGRDRVTDALRLVGIGLVAIAEDDDVVLVLLDYVFDELNVNLLKRAEIACIWEICILN